MTLEEQAAYLQQLKAAAGLSPARAKENLLLELADTVSLLCHQIYRIDAVADGLNETLEILQEELESFAMSEDGTEPGDCCDGAERPLYEIKCPQCCDRFAVDEATLSKGFSCPTCGAHLVQSE